MKSIEGVMMSNPPATLLKITGAQSATSTTACDGPTELSTRTWQQHPSVEGSMRKLGRQGRAHAGTQLRYSGDDALKLPLEQHMQT